MISKYRLSIILIDGLFTKVKIDLNTGLSLIPQIHGDDKKRCMFYKKGLPALHV